MHIRGAHVCAQQGSIVAKRPEQLEQKQVAAIAGSSHVSVLDTIEKLFESEGPSSALATVK
jgi:hypothetical protein